MKIVPMVGHPFAVEKEKLNGMLQSLASSLGSRKARMVGDIDVWGAEGRFCGDVDGSRRCGCFVCDAGPMARWCWVDHAASGGHSKGLQRFKRDLQRALFRATVQEQPRGYRGKKQSFYGVDLHAGDRSLHKACSKSRYCYIETNETDLL